MKIYDNGDCGKQLPILDRHLLLCTILFFFNADI